MYDMVSVCDYYPVCVCMRSRLCALSCWLCVYVHVCVTKKNSAGPFTLDPRTEFNAHRMRIRRVHTWIRFGWCAFDVHRVNPLLEVDWNRIGTEFIVYSSNNDKIMHGYALKNSNIVEAFASRPPYTLYLPSKVRTMMAYHAWTPLTRCCWKRDHLPSGLV